MNIDSTLSLSAQALALIDPWPGPYGGLPPLAGVQPAALEEALRTAIEIKRAEVQAVSANTAPPSFANTVEALEDCGRVLDRVLCIFGVYSKTLSLGEMPATVQRIAPLLPALDDQIAHDERLFARVQQVWAQRESLTLEQQRLVDVWRQRLQRRGAGLAAPTQARLAQINARLAELSARYSQNLLLDAEQAVFIEEAAGLDGLAPAQREAAAQCASAKGRTGVWAIPNVRGTVWPFLTHATHRGYREKVWRMWTQRGDNEGPHDNKPLAAEMLQLRGELAHLMGYASFAHYALAERMVVEPQAVSALLEGTWARVKPMAEQQIADYQAIAHREGLGHALQPWDRLHYAEKLRRERFGLDGDEVKAHFPLQAVLQAMFWAAGRVHGLAFKRIHDAPLVHPSVQVYEASRGTEVLGILYFDFFNRSGKAHGSYQFQCREAEHFKGRVLPISGVVSSFPPPPNMDQGAPVLLPWEYANVFFHEFGHALHMLHCSAAYRSLGSQHVAWDFVELPALLNERWLRDPELLQRFARHHITGEPISPALIERIEQGLRYDRIFSLNPDFLLPAIVDMRLHLLADGSGQPIDPVAVENQTLAALGLPAAWDVIMRVTHNFHLFEGGHYAAGLYSYLWSDVMAADAAACFERSPGGIYDAATAQSWIAKVLSVGHRVPAAEAFRDFAGHAPDPTPLHQRFGLLEAGT
jgi:peptidyl-dipeptidase Dcp